MAYCAIATSIEFSCDKARKVGGLGQKVWLVSSPDGFTYTTNGSGYITALSFDTYEGLVNIEAIKNSHSAGYELVLTEGGNKFTKHNVLVKCITETPTEIGAIEDLFGWSAAIIVETRNREFYIYGIDNGMNLAAAVQNSGAVAASDISNILTFEGEENSLPKRMLVTDYATTLAYLEAAEI